MFFKMSEEQKPAEPLKNDERKYFSALSYIIVMVLVGIPIWWKTTEVYRARLPYAQIEELTSLSTVQKINVLLITPDAAESHSRGPELQKILHNSEIYDVTLSVRTPLKHEQDIIEAASSVGEIDDKLGKNLGNSLPGSVALVEIPHKHFLEPPSITIGNYRTIYFSSYVRSDELAGVVMDNVLGEADMIQMLLARSDSGRDIQRLQVDPMRKPSISEVDIYLSLLIPEPENVMASWDIELATRRYLQPFLDRFPQQFRVRSQVLYLTGLNIPGATGGSGPLEVSSDQLGVAVNSVESILASQSSNSPALNFLLYIPPIHRTPLTIKDSPTNSFLLPRWGGIHIYNYHVAGEDNIKFPAKISVDMEAVMGIWLGQLRTLLGVKEVAGVSALPVPHWGLRDWELDYQMRQRSLENILETGSTLSSLVQLISQIANIVIREEIRETVETGVEAAMASSAHLAAGRLPEAFSLSRQALTSSEAAFFHPSLLALLYFPDDQKYAIYIPYFLPVGIPVLMSMRTVLKWLQQKKIKEE